MVTPALLGKKAGAKSRKTGMHPEKKSRTDGSDPPVRETVGRPQTLWIHFMWPSGWNADAFIIGELASDSTRS
jgi:hypothetical protein